MKSSRIRKYHTAPHPELHEVTHYTLKVLRRSGREDNGPWCTSLTLSRTRKREVRKHSLHYMIDVDLLQSLMLYRVLVAMRRCDDSQKSEPRLFRTYHHLPSGFPSDPSETRLRNLGAAGSISVRQVALVSLAVSLYFESITIGSEKSGDGYSGFYNPNWEAAREIQAMYRLETQHDPRLAQAPNSGQPKEDRLAGANIGNRQPAIAVFVSIGTGKCPRFGFPIVHNPIASSKSAIGSHQYPNGNENTAPQAGDGVFFRFDVAEGLDIPDVDEWNEHISVIRNSTRSLIERKTAEYLPKREIQDELEACAKEILWCRRRQL